MPWMPPPWGGVLVAAGVRLAVGAPAPAGILDRRAKDDVLQRQRGHHAIVRLHARCRDQETARIEHELRHPHRPRPHVALVDDVNDLNLLLVQVHQFHPILLGQLEVTEILIPVHRGPRRRRLGNRHAIELSDGLEKLEDALDGLGVRGCELIVDRHVVGLDDDPPAANRAHHFIRKRPKGAECDVGSVFARSQRHSTRHRRGRSRRGRCRRSGGRRSTADPTPRRKSGKAADKGALEKLPARRRDARPHCRILPSINSINQTRHGRAIARIVPTRGRNAYIFGRYCPV